MNTEAHPSTENIIAFLESPNSSEYHDLELHLATCCDCRQQANQLSQLQKDIQSSDFIQQKLMQDISMVKSTELEAALSDSKIENYVDQSLDKNERDSIALLLKEDPLALKAALHYASHQSAMQRELSEQDSEVTKPINNFDLISLLKKYISWRTPAWVMVPATGFASVLLVFAISTQVVTTESVSPLASYQDNAVIQYSGKNTQPGIGFFSNAFTKVKPFNNISIELVNESTLILSWPKVSDAVSYYLQLQKIDKGQNIIIGESTGTENTVEFKNIQLQKRLRYQWILTGKTTADETFYASGGFVRH